MEISPQTLSFMEGEKEVKRNTRTKATLESALTGALRAGDNMSEQMVQLKNEIRVLTQTIFRQRSTIRRAINLIKCGRAELGVTILTSELDRGDYK